VAGRIECPVMPRASALLVVFLAACATPAPPKDELDEWYYRNPPRARDWEGVKAALDEIHQKLRADPEWAEGWKQRGNILGAHGYGDMALASYDRALTLQPKYVEALLARGLALAERGRDADAERDFAAAIEAAPKIPDGYLLRAWMERRLGRYSESERDLAQARALGRWEDYHNAGATAARAGKWKLAELNLELAVLLSPGHADGWIALSRVHASMGQPDRALDDLNRADTQRFGDAAIWYARAELLRSLYRWEEAVRAYDVAISLGAVPMMYAGRGQAKAAIGGKEAEADLDRAVQLEPELREAWIARARVRAAAGKFEAAREDYNAALRIRASASVLRELARIHHDQERWDPAIQIYEAALGLCDDPALETHILRDLGDAKARQK
jgi:tetratricopeptide (TPR) repeat protein